MNGSLLSPELLSQITTLIRKSLREHLSFDDVRDKKSEKSVSRFPEYWVILNEALPAATHSLTGFSSAKATICKWSESRQRLVETDRSMTVYNHSEESSFALNTFGLARAIPAGHYVFFGDCEAMGSR